MIGLLHPPMGMVLFVLARVAKLSVERTTMAILPWLVPLLVALVVLTYVPSIVLLLPRYFGVGGYLCWANRTPRNSLNTTAVSAIRPGGPWLIEVVNVRRSWYAACACGDVLETVSVPMPDLTNRRRAQALAAVVSLAAFGLVMCTQPKQDEDAAPRVAPCSASDPSCPDTVSGGNDAGQLGRRATRRSALRAVQRPTSAARGCVYGMWAVAALL